MAKQQHQCLPSIHCSKTLASTVSFFATLCSFTYFLGLYRNSGYQFKNIPFPDTLKTSQTSLDFQPHHVASLPPTASIDLQPLEFCKMNYTNYCPCQDPYREERFTMRKAFHRERHCPERNEVLRCLIPRPSGYRSPFGWPESREFAWFANVPFKALYEDKKRQNWLRIEGNRWFFPGGGTSFPNGEKSYIDKIGRVVPLKSGDVRTVLDVGSGVASFGAYLMDLNILTMSVAPRDA